MHPLITMRKTKWGRLALRLFDRPVWVHLSFARTDRVKVRVLSHAAYFLTPSGPEGALGATFRGVVSSRSARTFVDVGANIGAYTWTFLSLVPDGEVIAVEPDPASLSLLRATASRWGRLVEVHGVALSDEDATANFSQDSFGGHRGSLLPATGRKVITVRTRRLDDLVGRRRVDIVKIDVEGAEALVLAGARETLERDQPCLIVECFHHPPRCLDLVEQLGYALLDGERGGPADDRTTNYLAVPAAATMPSPR
jgi:FkbM family methyltransferase